MIKVPETAFKKTKELSKAKKEIHEVEDLSEEIIQNISQTQKKMW